MLEVTDSSSIVLGEAERLLFGKPPSGAFEINRLDELRPYEKTRLNCRAFVERLAQRLPAPPSAP